MIGGFLKGFGRSETETSALARGLGHFRIITVTPRRDAPGLMTRLMSSEMARRFGAKLVFGHRVLPWHRRLDPEVFARDNDAESLGAANGRDLIPPADAREYPLAVRQFFAAAQRYVRRAMTHLHAQMLDIQRVIRQLWVPNPDPLISHLRGYADQVARGQLQAHASEWFAVTLRLARCERLYEYFRWENRLKDDPRPPGHWLWFATLAVVFVAAETGVNYKLFEDSTDTGTIGAIMIAGLTAMFNIAVSTLAGYVFGRQCLRVQWGPKLVGWLGTLVFVMAITAADVLFATFRFITASGVDAGVALNSLYLRQNLEGAANDGLSIVLVVLGGLVSALSFWKGMTMFSDRYPGYLELWRDLQDARADYNAVTALVMAELAEIGTAAMAQLDHILSQAEAIYVAFMHELAEIGKLSDWHARSPRA